MDYQINISKMLSSKLPLSPSEPTYRKSLEDDGGGGRDSAFESFKEDAHKWVSLSRRFRLRLEGEGNESEILGRRPGKPLFIWVWTPVPSGAQPRPDVRCMCPGDMGRKLTPPGPLLLAPVFA